MTESKAYIILEKAGYGFKEIHDICEKKKIDVTALATQELLSRDTPLFLNYSF